MILLVGDDGGVLVHLECGGAEVVAVLVALYASRAADRGSVFDGERLDQADAAGVVGDVQALALGVEGAVDGLTVELEAAQVDALGDGGSALVDLDLADAVAGGVVGVAQALQRGRVARPPVSGSW